MWAHPSGDDDIDYSDAPELDAEFWANAEVREPTQRKNRPCVIAALNGRSDLRGRRRLLVKMDQHGRPPSRSSLRTDLAMNRAERRGEM
jgi:hypothetical protein